MKSKKMLREMTLTDIPSVVNVHKSSWRPDEISIKLGDRYLNTFYTSIVTAPDAFTYLFEYEGQIIGYASGFEDYPRFNRRMRNSNFLALLFITACGLLKRRLTVADMGSGL